jgi:hypothetical protein
MKKKQPLKETFKRIGGKLNEQPGEHPVAGGGDYYYKSHHEGDGVDFDEFMSNIRNYSSSDERDEILTYLTDQIIKNYTDSDLNDLMYEMSMEFEVGPDGSRR